MPELTKSTRVRQKGVIKINKQLELPVGTTLLSGPTGCGKTNLLKNLVTLEPWSALILLTSTAGASNEYEDIPWTKTSTATEEDVVETFDIIESMVNIGMSPRSLIVIDDPIGPELSISSRMKKLAGYVSKLRKYNCSLIIMVQRYNVPATTIRENLAYVYQWRTTVPILKQIHEECSITDSIDKVNDHLQGPYSFIGITRNYIPSGGSNVRYF